MKKILFTIFKIITTMLISTVAVFMVILNSSFGDYRVTSYDVIINLILFVVYGLLAVIVLISFKVKFDMFYLLLVPVAFVALSFIWEKNPHKKIVLEGEIDVDIWPSVDVKMFDNSTFEIIVSSPHVIDHLKGRYTKEQNYIFLNRDDIEVLTDSLCTQQYQLVEGNRLEPNSDQFAVIKISYIEIE